MKKQIYLLAILLLFAVSFYAQVNGELTQVNDKWILQTWGTHMERGYAQGYLLSQPIMQIANTYIFQIVAMGDTTIYNTILNFYLAGFTIEPKYHQEAQGIINGMLASGTNINITGLNRQINKDDLLLLNCLVDFYPYFSSINSIGGEGVHCSSLSSWGTTTQQDSLLNGNAVITRFMDWSQDGSLIANPLLMISHPSELDEQKWISFTYPGLLGGLSAISESGKAAFLNMGNDNTTNVINNLHPVLLSIRNAIEMSDYNDDNVDNIIDVFDAVDDGLSLSGTIIHTISENPAVMTGVIETNNNLGTVMRNVTNNTALPGMNLAATNHFRLLTYPVCCTRYANIVDSLVTNPIVTAKRQLSLLSGAAGQDNNMMAIQYIPSNGNILWSTATLTQPAFQNQYLALNKDVLMAYNTIVEDEEQTPISNKLNVYPNPARLNSDIIIKSDKNTTSPLEVYNLKGQKVAILQSEGKLYHWNGKNKQGKSTGAGIYLFKLKSETGENYIEKLILLP